MHRGVGLLSRVQLGCMGQWESREKYMGRYESTYRSNKFSCYQAETEMVKETIVKKMMDVYS